MISTENMTDERLVQALADAKKNLPLPSNDNVPENIKAGIIAGLEAAVKARGLGQ